MSLERHLGVRIFDRVGRSVRPTARAKSFRSAHRATTGRAQPDHHQPAAAGGSAAGRVRLGASESVCGARAAKHSAQLSRL